MANKDSGIVFKKINYSLLILLLVLNLIAFYFIILGPIQQTFYPPKEAKEVIFKFHSINLIIFFTILSASIIIFIKYRKYGTAEEIEYKIIEIMHDRKGRSAYEVSREINKKYNIIGLQYNTVYRIMKNMLKEGKLKKRGKNYYLS